MKYVALLRGINVGGNARVEMARLKATFEDLGFKDVKTYINSGNVIFSTTRKSPARMTTDIEAAIEQDFGFRVPVVLRDEDAMVATAKALPRTWVNDQSVRTDVIFLWREVDSPKVLEQLIIKPGIDKVRYVPGAILWHMDRKNVTRSGLNGTVSSDIYKKVTIRNATTVRKLVALLNP
ncbi:MAG: DUF1697 domain-containing protein [Actinobacteria bacterium]|nr:DUF1697 domain-containing protein [Actinomycetota bacterium]